LLELKESSFTYKRSRRKNFAKKTLCFWKILGTLRTLFDASNARLRNDALYFSNEPRNRRLSMEDSLKFERRKKQECKKADVELVDVGFSLANA